MEQVNEIIARMVQAQYGSPNHSAFVEKHMGEYLAKWPSYKDRFTHLEWYHLFLDAIESYDSCTASECDRLKEELAELKKSTFDEAFKTVEEIHSLKAELEKERTTGRQEWERLQLDKIDSLKEELDNTQKELADIQINLSTAEDQIDSLKGENERIKKELTYFKEGAEYQLGVEYGCDSLKQLNSELILLINNFEGTRIQTNFFMDGYRNGSASISEVTKAQEEENTAFELLIEVAKKKQP